MQMKRNRQMKERQKLKEDQDARALQECTFTPVLSEGTKTIIEHGIGIRSRCRLSIVDCNFLPTKSPPFRSPPLNYHSLVVNRFALSILPAIIDRRHYAEHLTSRENREKSVGDEGPFLSYLCPPSTLLPVHHPNPYPYPDPYPGPYPYPYS